MKKHSLNRMFAAFLLGSTVSLGAIQAAPNAAFANSEVSQPQEELAITLNRDILVEGDSIFLRDIFQNAGHYGDRVVATAPEVGKEKRLSTSWLARIAKHYKLDWRPASEFDEAVVSRASYEMDASLIIDGLRDAIFEETGSDENIEIQLSGRVPSFHIPTETDMSVAIKNFRLSSDGTRFNANYVVPAIGKPVAKGKLAGKVHHLIDVAIPNRRMQAGEIIRAEDLEMVTMRERKISRKAVIDPYQLVGLQLRRTVTPGRPILVANLQLPTLVKKNTMVLISLEIMGMRLTAQGVALQSGAHKQVIHVRNSKSGKIVEAVITGYNSVTVRPPMQAAQM